QILFAKERMNHAMTDFMQAQDGKGFGVRFVFFLLPVLLRIEVMSRHLTVKWATAEGARIRVDTVHKIVSLIRWTARRQGRIDTWKPKSLDTVGMPRLRTRLPRMVQRPVRA